DAGAEWVPVRGAVRVSVGGRLAGFATGDGVEVLGQFRLPLPASNPGETDGAEALRDQGVHALLAVKTVDGVRPCPEADVLSVTAAVARVRAWAHRVLQTHLPAPHNGVAQAL